MTAPGPDPFPTCYTCPWLCHRASSQYTIAHDYCGFTPPPHFTTEGRPTIVNPATQGCSFHPRALAWAQYRQPRLEIEGGHMPAPPPEPPPTPQERRRAIRSPAPLAALGSIEARAQFVLPAGYRMEDGAEGWFVVDDEGDEIMGPSPTREALLDAWADADSRPAE